MATRIPTWLSGLLLPLGLCYGAAMWVRALAFRIGLRRSYAPGVPVICVGNLTVGGTGKTPVVATVVSLLQAMGRRPMILSRGYKSKDGQSDEAMLLEKLTGAPVVVDPDRVDGAVAAIGRGADVLVMDDGFQHLRLRRDLDIVLIDATNPFGGGWCLPAGLLREPVSGLKRAGLVVITRGAQVAPAALAKLERSVRRRTSVPILFAHHAPKEFRSLTGETAPLDSLTAPAVAFCGLGNPDGFFATLEAVGVELAGTTHCADHAHYTPELMAQLEAVAAESGATSLVTTEKDGVKLDPAWFTMPLWQLAIEMQFSGSDATLRDALSAALGVEGEA
ncbi:MAG: tetraacyldisaccharide 4'-kinase [Phycisphaerales bacterium]|jgi:tetraacyldisaccharide 4'-kinase|nr:tetraacyldisaccharide 4'-kinase [Phycisphaerales bacterium]MBT7171776.1 tetraacyldisaccharide 4'-kinase [Phycisphaerales bacterium]